MGARPRPPTSKPQSGKQRKLPPAPMAPVPTQGSMRTKKPSACK